MSVSDQDQRGNPLGGRTRAPIHRGRKFSGKEAQRTKDAPGTSILPNRCHKQFQTMSWSFENPTTPLCFARWKLFFIPRDTTKSPKDICLAEESISSDMCRAVAPDTDTMSDIYIRLSASCSHLQAVFTPVLIAQDRVPQAAHVYARACVEAPADGLDLRLPAVHACLPHGARVALQVVLENDGDITRGRTNRVSSGRTGQKSRKSRTFLAKSRTKIGHF